MKNIALASLLIIALLLAPFSHALGMACIEDNCNAVELLDNNDTDAIQEDGSLPHTDHHCCCSHIVMNMDCMMMEETQPPAHHSFFFHRTQKMPVMVGLPLRPPAQPAFL